MNTSALRTRWAAVGAAVAVSLGAGGVGITQATTSSGERAIYAPLDEPCRLADNRPDGIGPEMSATFSGWGMVGDCDLPDGTSGLALNVTAVDATQQTNLRLYAADVPVPATANLNPTPGAPPIPNAVNVALSDTGEFKVFNKFGTVAVIIDVMGVYDDHNHDDRYYQKSEVDTAVGAKANSDDVYTKAESDEQYLSEIVLSHGTAELTANDGSGASSVINLGAGSIVSGDGVVNLSVSGVAEFGGVQFGIKEVSYCVRQFSGSAFVDSVTVNTESEPFLGASTDGTNRATPGCYTMTANRSDGHAYDVQFTVAGGGSLRIAGVQTTWVPASSLPAPTSTPDEGAADNGN